MRPSGRILFFWYNFFMPVLKQTILHSLEANDLEAVVALATENRKVLSQLVRMAYDKETLVGWRAIKAIGLVAGELVKTDDEFLRVTIRKLLWSLSDESGGIGWSAPEILGEIVSADPKRFSDIIPLISEVYKVEEKVFRPGILYALGRIAEVDPALVMPFIDVIEQALSDENPLTRVHALMAIKTLKDKLGRDDWERFSGKIKSLLSDKAEVWLYEKDSFVGVQVKEVACTLS